MRCCLLLIPVFYGTSVQLHSVIEPLLLGRWRHIGCKDLQVTSYKKKHYKMLSYFLAWAIAVLEDIRLAVMSVIYINHERQLRKLIVDRISFCVHDSRENYKTTVITLL